MCNEPQEGGFPSRKVNTFPIECLCISFHLLIGAIDFMLMHYMASFACRCDIIICVLQARDTWKIAVADVLTPEEVQKEVDRITKLLDDASNTSNEARAMKELTKDWKTSPSEWSTARSKLKAHFEEIGRREKSVKMHPLIISTKAKLDAHRHE